MIAPEPVGTPTTAQTGSTTTSHSITLPSGVAAGEYLLVAATFLSDSAGTWSVGSPGGFWTLGLSANAGVSGAAQRMICRTWYLLCSGTEGGTTFTVTTSKSAVSAMIATRVNPHTTGSISTAGQIGGVGTNPPNVSWPSGTYDTLAWTIWWHFDNDPTYAAAVPPTGYTLIRDVVSTGTVPSASHARCALAYARLANVGSVDPPSWSGNDGTVTFTLSPGTYLWRNDEVEVLAVAYWGIDARLPA